MTHIHIHLQGTGSFILILLLLIIIIFVHTSVIEFFEGMVYYCTTSPIKGVSNGQLVLDILITFY